VAQDGERLVAIYNSLQLDRRRYLSERKAYNGKAAAVVIFNA
jgi:hypothetical protein